MSRQFVKKSYVDILSQEISLREAALTNSRREEQGYTHCHFKKKCSNLTKCSCESNRLFYNSKYNKSLNCCNK